MDVLFKTSAGILVAVVVCLVLAKQGKDFAVLLTIAVCCMVIGVAVGYLSKIFDFIKLLEDTGSLNPELMAVILKSTAIGLISEITVTICNDSGNAALGKSLQVLSVALVLWLCIPLFTELITLIEEVLSSI